VNVRLPPLDRFLYMDLPDHILPFVSQRRIVSSPAETTPQPPWSLIRRRRPSIRGMRPALS
jgi:hypothetical protein